MYLVYSIHPKSYKVTARSVHRDHEQAISALVKQSYDYITKYRGHKDLKSAKSLEEIDQAEGPGFFYIISDDFDDRLTIYEKKEISKAGYVASAKYEIHPYLIFSMANLPHIPGSANSDTGHQIPSFIAPKNVDKLENIKPDVVQDHHSHYMSELHALLKKRGPVETETQTQSVEKPIDNQVKDMLEALTE